MRFLRQYKFVLLFLLLLVFCSAMVIRQMDQNISRHIELREAFIPRIAPVSPHLILCFIAEKVLGMPKSY